MAVAVQSDAHYLWHAPLFGEVPVLVGATFRTPFFLVNLHGQRGYFFIGYRQVGFWNGDFIFQHIGDVD